MANIRLLQRLLLAPTVNFNLNQIVATFYINIYIESFFYNICCQLNKSVIYIEFWSHFYTKDYRFTNIFFARHLYDLDFTVASWVSFYFPVVHSRMFIPLHLSEKNACSLTLRNTAAFRQVLCFPPR
jgi:hypothetical protein